MWVVLRSMSLDLKPMLLSIQPILEVYTCVHIVFLNCDKIHVETKTHTQTIMTIMSNSISTQCGLYPSPRINQTLHPNHYCNHLLFDLYTVWVEYSLKSPGPSLQRREIKNQCAELEIMFLRQFIVIYVSHFFAAPQSQYCDRFYRIDHIKEA